MTVRSFADVIKDATAASVHAVTALGNQRRRKKPKADNSGDANDGASDDSDTEKHFAKGTVVKVDKSLGLVFGFAIVCKQDGEDYFDLQDDHIPEASMLAAATDFMLNSRVAKEMHDGEPIGTVVFAFPLTTDIAKALEIETKTTGLLIAMKPSPDVLAQFADGTYTGFSMGGSRTRDKEVA